MHKQGKEALLKHKDCNQARAMLFLSLLKRKRCRANWSKNFKLQTPKRGWTLSKITAFLSFQSSHAAVMNISIRLA
jgi:hypothetical protein